MKLLRHNSRYYPRLLLVLVLFFWNGVLQAEDTGAVDSAAQAESKRKTTSILRVEIQGIKGELLDNAKAFLDILQKKDDPNLNELWIKHLHESAVEEIQQALQPFGYYNVLVEDSLERDEKGGWVARYVVTSGSQVKIAKTDVKWLGEGVDEPELIKALDDFPLKSGQPLNHALYEQAKTALLEQADNLGYPDVEATKARVLVNPKTNRADIQLYVDTGDKYYIGDIQLQQDFLATEFVERYLADVRPGDVYSQDNLLEIQQDLIQAGYFSLVDVNPRFEQADGQTVPVDVKLSPAKRQTYSFGVGYDTDIGVNLTMRWNHRRLNKRGHKADARLKLSANESLIRGDYWIPIKDPRTHKLGFGSRLETETTDSTERLTWDLEAGYYYRWQEWISKLYTEFKWERFTAGAEPEETTTLLSIGGRAERSYFEEGVYPQWAWSLYADLRGSPGWISSTDYIRTHIKSRVFLPVFQDGRFILRGELGLAQVGDFSKYPNSLRFFAGGDQSVRGYDWKSLGPTDEYDEVIGGKQALTASVEYNHRVAEQWVGAVFVDTGNAFNDELDKLYYGGGVGVRWLSPVGSVRADVAWPLNEDEEDPEFGDIHLHFGFEVTL